MTMNSERIKQHIASDRQCPDCHHEMILKIQTSLCQDDAPVLLMWFCKHCAPNSHAVQKCEIAVMIGDDHTCDKCPVV